MAERKRIKKRNQRMSADFTKAENSDRVKKRRESAAQIGEGRGGQLSMARAPKEQLRRGGAREIHSGKRAPSKSLCFGKRKSLADDVPIAVAHEM